MNMKLLAALDWAADAIKRDDGGDMTTETGWASDEALEHWLEIRSLIKAANKIEQQCAALEAVEKWWLDEGMSHFTGAPYAIFAARAAINN